MLTTMLRRSAVQPLSYDKEVKILKITTIEQGHKLYGRLDL